MAYPKVDFKGFEKEVHSARRVMSRHGKVYAVKINGTRLAFRGYISDKLEFMIECGEARILGVYQKPLRSPDLVEDLHFEMGNENA